jgi:hypothetical protein
MARAYPYDSSTQALYRPAAAPAFFEDWTDECVSGLTGRLP